MTLLSPQKAGYAAYNNESVLSATPVQLVTMLYDRLILDLNRAQAAQEAADWLTASTQLIHAQAIVTELQTTLRTDAWDGAESLDSLYTFISTALIDANLKRDIQQTRDCIALLEPLGQAWHDAAQTLPAQNSTTTPTEGNLGIG